MPETGHFECAGLCLGCSYPLRSLPEHRCPECGRAFDPDNPYTMKVTRPTGLLATIWLKPPGWPTAVAASLVMMLTLSAFSPPLPYRDLYGAALPAWIVLGLCWITRLWISMSIGVIYRQTVLRNWRYWVRWAVLPLIGALTCWIVRIDAPLHLAFRLSKPSMQSTVDKILAGGELPQPSRLGVFPIDEIDDHSDWLNRFFGGDSGWISFTVRDAGGYYSTCGFAYDKTGKRQHGKTPGYTHITGNWYHWTEEFW